MEERRNRIESRELERKVLAAVRSLERGEGVALKRVIGELLQLDVQPEPLETINY